MNAAPAALFAALLWLPACSGPDAAEAVEAAQAALDGGQPDRARALAEAALPAARSAADPALAWRLERVALQALAEEGRADQALASLERLSATAGGQVDAELYARLAQRASKAEHPLAALELAHTGAERFPEAKDAFEPVISDLEAQALDEELYVDDSLRERLEQLGYLGKSK